MRDSEVVQLIAKLSPVVLLFNAFLGQLCILILEVSLNKSLLLRLLIGLLPLRTLAQTSGLG